MNLHLLRGYAFGASAITLFERYAPGDNWYVFTAPHFTGKDYDCLAAQPEHLPELLDSRTARRALLVRMRDRGVKKLFVHYLSEAKAGLAFWLKQRLDIQVYWIFFGADLYGPLHQAGRYELYDPSTPLVRKGLPDYWFQLKYRSRRRLLGDPAFADALAGVDYFCFWNYFDYQLLVDNYAVTASYKPFLYYTVVDLELPELLAKKPKSVLLNNSADRSGNHLGMLQLLNRVDLNGEVTVTIPLSYGDTAYGASVLAAARRSHGERATALTEFMPQADYYALLSGFSAAVYGHRRQQAAGNIFFLLAAGVKVFLRQDNNMLRWLRQKGFIVHCVETDLNTAADLTELLPHEVANNRAVYRQTFSGEDERAMMDGLLKA